MNNLMNCWDKCVSLVNPLATEDITEGKEILIEDSFTEFLDFCKAKSIELSKNNRAIIMKNFMPTIKGRADGKLANKIISESLT